MAIWSRLTAFVTGGAVATATADAMRPEFEVLKQTAWRNEPHRTLDPSTAAELRARETVEGTPGIGNRGVDYNDDAARDGVGSNRFELLTELARTQPGLGELIRLRRRNMATEGKAGITDPDLTESLRRSGYTAEHVTAIRALVLEKLSPQDLAAAIHRGLIPDQGLLKGEKVGDNTTIPRYPVYPIDALNEVQDSGFDRDRLGVLVGLQGFPMGPIEAANAFFRGNITYDDYIMAFNLSNNRNEWAKATLEYAKQIPTARDYIENALRGYRTFKQAADGAARHGMSEADALTIFQNSGRPLNLHQITQALAWGAEYKPAPADNPNPYTQAVLLGAVRPEYYDLQESLKYNLPSAFFFRVLQQQNVLTTDEAVTWYKRLGWPPELAQKVADAFGASTSSTTNPYVAKAETQLWTTTHRSYINAESDIADVTGNLTLLGIPDADQSAIVGLWTNERELIRKQLTPTQVKKAYAKAAINATTGQPWTQEEALDALTARGYSATEAHNLLNLP